MTTKNKKSVYEELSKKFSDAEIAESFVLPLDLTPEVKDKQDKNFMELRLKRLSEMTEKEYLQTELIRLRFQIENYIHSSKYDEIKNFGYFLNEYIHSIRKTNTEFARDISLHTSTLSRLLNSKEEPNSKILIRLEIHSNNTIPAILWYRIVKKQKEFDLMNDKKTRVEEKRKVRKAM
ncbi:MAG: hypothetical protein IPJ86_12650 [Bacteroidetes bacterium]|jgi:plasmid maintenance system antidote protein VapI|nr:hypothetical protein [Bacteroidota bacterium]